jgi:hypothetical protein
MRATRGTPGRLPGLFPSLFPGPNEELLASQGVGRHFQQVTSMRRRSAKATPSLVVKLATNAIMGVAMGLTFALALTLLDQSGIAHLIDHSTDHRVTVLVFVGTIVTTFSVGATLTGLLLIMTEDS